MNPEGKCNEARPNIRGGNRRGSEMSAVVVNLDAFAAAWGEKPRAPGECDADLRARLADSLFARCTGKLPILQPGEKPPRYVSPAALPSGSARELLVVLMEECGEAADEFATAIVQLAAVQKRAAKALRFGLAEVQPGQIYTNADRLAHEIGDMQEVVQRLVQRAVLDPDAILAGRENKRRQLARFMQNQDSPAPADSPSENAPAVTKTCNT